MASPADVHFVKLLDARFAQFGQACALTFVHIAGLPVLPLTAILIEGENRSDFGLAGPVLQEGTLLLIRASEIETLSSGNEPQKNNTVTMVNDGRTFTIIETPSRRDHRRMVWTMILKDQAA